MKIYILSICVFLHLSISSALDKIGALHGNSSKLTEISIQPGKINITRFDENPSRKVDKMVSAEYRKIREYILLSDFYSKVIIIDANSYEKVISYSMPEIAKSVLAIVDNTFYNIDTFQGAILSISIINILKGPYNITWKHAGSFPKESKFIRGNPAVHDSIIYFATNSGILYLYDTKKKIVIKIGAVKESSTFASLMMINNILYIHKLGNFYTYDGNSINSIAMDPKRYFSGLFQMGEDVCIVGGNHTNVYPDPVRCYNPKSRNWTVPNYINEARRYPGVVTTGSKTFLFGGWALFASRQVLAYWRDSVEVLDHESNVWGFIPSPLTLNQPYIQALAFYY